MAQKGKKTSILSRLRNNFFAGAVVLIPIGITLYLSLFIIKVSSNILPKELNPNNYLPFEIPGIEIIIAVMKPKGGILKYFLSSRAFSINFSLSRNCIDLIICWSGKYVCNKTLPNFCHRPTRYCRSTFRSHSQCDIDF